MSADDTVDGHWLTQLTADDTVHGHWLTQLTEDAWQFNWIYGRPPISGEGYKIKINLKKHKYTIPSNYIQMDSSLWSTLSEWDTGQNRHARTDGHLSIPRFAPAANSLCETITHCFCYFLWWSHWASMLRWFWLPCSQGKSNLSSGHEGLFMQARFWPISSEI